MISIVCQRASIHKGSDVTFFGGWLVDEVMKRSSEWSISARWSGRRLATQI